MIENSAEVKLCINIESNSLEITIQFYSCYGEHEAHSSCNRTVYLSPTINNLPVVYDTTSTAKYGEIIVTLCMGLAIE